MISITATYCTPQHSACELFSSKIINNGWWTKRWCWYLWEVQPLSQKWSLICTHRFLSVQWNFAMLKYAVMPGGRRWQKAVLLLWSWRQQGGSWSDIFQAEMCPPPVDYRCFLKQRPPTHEVLQLALYTKSTWSGQTCFISGLNILDNFLPRQRAHMLHSVISSGRITVAGIWGIGVTSQEYSNYLQRNEI